MNFADLENTWRSPLNQPNASELEALKMNLVADLEKRRRGHRRFLITVFVPLALFTVVAAGHLFSPSRAGGAIHLSREWGLLPFLLLPWAAWTVIFRLHRGHVAAHRDFAASIRTSVAASLDENRTECRRTWLIGALLTASVPLLGIVVLQLRATGKAGDEILLPAMVLYPLYVFAMLGGFAWRYRRKLQPRRQELETLLRSYE